MMQSIRTSAHSFTLPYYANLIAILILFVLALGLRIYYQQKTTVRNQIISDAREYFLGAYNLRFFGTYSTLPPKSGVPPRPNAGRTPGYSLFLVPFIYVSKTIPQFLNRVMTSQAVLGAVTSVMSFLMARLFLNIPLAFCVGLLTAISPHLIAMDDYLLTECLFTFTLIVATVVMMMSWIRAKWWQALIAGLLFGFGALVRPAALLLGPFVALAYLFSPHGWRFSSRTTWTRLILCFVIGISLAISPYLIRNLLVVGKVFPESGRGWASMVDGTYINLTYKNPRFYGYPYRDDPQNAKMKRDRTYFFEVFKKRLLSRPWPYIKWYLGGKVLCSWRWSVVTGNRDVYVYPMKRFGFHNNALLYKIHTLMHILHWPLVCLALLSPLVLAISKKLKVLPDHTVVLLPAILILIYHVILMTVMFPIPRYTIPLRPYCYFLAISTSLFLARLLLGNKTEKVTSQRI